MTRGRLRQWLVLGVAIVTAGALGTTSASAQSAVPAASAGAPSAKAQACIKGTLVGRVVSPRFAMPEAIAPEVTIKYSWRERSS